MTTYTPFASLKKTLLDPLKSIFAKPAIPAPSPITATPIPGRVAGEQGFEITGGGRTSTPTPASTTAPVKPVIPKTTTTPSTFAPSAVPKTGAPTFPSAPPTYPTPPGQVQNATETTKIAPGTTETTKTTPTPSDAQNAGSAAEKAYEMSLKITPEELSTQEDLDKLYEATKLGVKDLEGQGRAIPLQLVRGQQEKLFNQSEIQAQTLETRLARIQAARTASLEASKFALTRADKKIADEKAAEKDKTALKEGTSFYDPTTKTWITAPAKPKEVEPFTLGPGEIRYDASGNVVARGGAKPMSDSQMEKATEKSEAKIKGKNDAIAGLDLANNILNSPYINQVFGAKNPFTYWTPGSNEQLVKSQRDQLVAMLSLENRAKLKGSGAISDFEARTLEKAASALNKSLSDKDAKRVLNQIKGAFATSAGLEASVKVTNPSTGESVSATASRDEINQLIAEGNEVEYQ